MTDKEIKEIKKKLINEIYLSIVKFVTGKRFSGKYIINGTSNVKMIEIVTNDGCPYIGLYFDSQIQIVISRDTAISSFEPISVLYTYFGDNDAIPYDVNEFVEVTKKFLCQLIKHVDSLESKLEMFPESYQKQYRTYAGKPSVDMYQKEFGTRCPDCLKPYADLNKILEYPFSYENKQAVLYMLFIFRLDGFKASRKCK